MLTQQRRMTILHTDPLDNLPSVEDKGLMDVQLKKDLKELGVQRAIVAKMTHAQRVKFYRLVADAVASSILCYSSVRRDEVEGLRKDCWENGLQNNPVGSRIR